MQEEADEAAFRRRAQAVDKERAIQENELANQIELAKRETQLIEQRGTNARREATEKAEADRIAVESKAAQSRMESAARAEALTAVEGARLALDASSDRKGGDDRRARWSSVVASRQRLASVTA